MEIIIISLAIATFFSTMVGGTVMLRFRQLMPLFFSFAAGSLIAVAFLDILPETINLAHSISFPIRLVMIIIVSSFFIYNLINKLFVTHCIGEDCNKHGHIMGPIGSGSLIIHSFFDGIAIGTAFKISNHVGFLVALAVIFHDFTDGINTVTLMLKNKQPLMTTLYFLFMDAFAPILGVIIIYFLNIPETILIIILSFFVGEFIYLGAANLLPETQKYSSKTLLAMAFAILLMILLTSIIP